MGKEERAVGGGKAQKGARKGWGTEEKAAVTGLGKGSGASEIGRRRESVGVVGGR